MELYRELAALCPDELSANPSLALTPEWELQASIAVCSASPASVCERLLAPLRALGPDTDAVLPMPYHSRRVRHAYGANYERLVAVKTAYDPTNFFSSNQNIAPAPV